MKTMRQIRLTVCATAVLVTAILVACPLCTYGADDAVPNDYDFLTRLLTDGIVSLIRSNVPTTYGGPPKTAVISYSGGYALSARAKDSIASTLTGAGFTLADGINGADYVFTVTISDARVVCMLRNDTYERLAHLTVHVKCFDDVQRILFAGSRTESHNDTIPKHALRASQNADAFSRGIKRHVLRPRFDRFRIASLTLSAAVLAYFAFQ